MNRRVEITLMAARPDVAVRKATPSANTAASAASN
jgi:hypothetical protein